MTDAIFYNRVRGTDREVQITLGNVGIEIQTAGGEPIATWPYSVVDLRKGTRTKGEGEFIADHDDVHALRIVDPALWGGILSRAPRARRTETKDTSVLWRMFFGAPDSTVWVIWVLLFVGIYMAGSAIYDWLF